MNEKERIFILEIPYAGLGDHIFHSHLPRIAKENMGFEKVFISNNSPVRHPDYKRIVWDYNPYVDGYVDEPGLKCDLSNIVARGADFKGNLLDEVMYEFGFENGHLWNEPEIYYQPRYREEFNKVIYDPNYLSWVGDVSKQEAQRYFDKVGHEFEAIMKIRSEKHLVVPENYNCFIETPTLEDFCDLIFSAKKIFCLTSGTATLAAGLGRSAHVFYGYKQPTVFQHSRLHNYELIRPSIKKQVKHLLYNLLKK